MDTASLGWAVAGSALAGLIKGTTGLGYASSALPFLVIAVGLHNAMAVVLVPTLATNIGVAFSTGYFVQTVTRFSMLYLSILPGIAAGLWLMARINQNLAIQVLGWTMVTYVLLALLKPSLDLPVRWHSALQVPTGFLNGVVAGVTGAQVMPLFPYMMSLRLEPARMVQAVNLAVMIASSALAIGLVAQGIMTAQLLLYSCLLTIPALMGVALGNQARRQLNSEQFRRIALLVLLLMGGLMLIR
jgi:uncharacterized protein